MPSDLATHPEAGLIQVRDRAGTGLPFSKGLMATSILATGLETDRAYAVAADVERVLRQTHRFEVSADELTDMAFDLIQQRVGDDAAQRYRAWRRAKRTGRPVTIVLAGAPGVGKSTLATRLAVRLGITRVVTTDTIREVLRTVIPKTVLPELHVSTFESVEAGVDTSHLGSFDRQARAVGAATAAVAARLVTEQRSAIIEGVHLLPGQVQAALAEHPSRPICVEMALVLEDELLHRAHLTHRLHGEPGRGGQRHLENLDSIRAVQQYLSNAAQSIGVPVYDITHPENLTQQIVDEVVGRLPADRPKS